MAQTKQQPTRKAQQTKVVTMRDKQHKSWMTIGAELGVAPRTARRMYDEVKGEGAHHGLLEGKGGRSPVEKSAAKKPAAKGTTKKAVAKKTNAA